MANIFVNQDINNFYQHAINVDFARKNLFRVLDISVPSNPYIKFDEKDFVYITTTSLPQRAINNIAVPFMGLTFNVPGTAKYPGSEAWNVTFRMPSDYSLRQKLELWSRNTFDDAYSTGAYSVGNLGSVTVALMDKAGQPVRIYDLVGAYLTNIGTYEVDVTNQGDVVTVQATMAYQFWQINPSSPQRP